ncbi:MAG: PAS domain S-box protein [Deltaproteobacteria bacterium]|nr:PAS domain S-box protein [Deltaproteobacteria bacterium]
MAKRRLLYLLPIVLLLIAVVAGWFATDYLGNKAREEMVAESRADALALSIYASSTFTHFERAVKTLAGSPLIAPALLSKGAQDIEHANSVLDRYNFALNASVAYLMDADGMTVASSNRNDRNSFVGKSYRFRPYFQGAANGQPAHYFALGITTGKRGFYASHPVQNSIGKVLGVVTMKKDLDEMEVFFSRHDAFSFLVSPDGIIFLSSAPAMVLKSLWPLDKAVQEKLIASRLFGNKPFGNGFFNKEITDVMEVTLEGKDYFVSRTVINDTGWSLVLLSSTGRVGAHKLSGILVTILACFFILFLSGIILVTDRSKEVIRQSEEKYRLLFESAGDAIFIHDAEGRMLAINLMACELLGYTYEELMSMTIDQLDTPVDTPVDTPEEVQHASDRTAQVMANGHLTFEAVHQHKDGALQFGWVSARLINWEGQPAIMSICRDTTERKQAEEALRESNDRHTAMIANNCDVIGIINADGIIEYISSNIERWFGWKPEDLVGTDGWKTVHPEDIERLQKEFHAGIEKDNFSTTVEYRNKCKDGSYRWIELTAVNCVNDPAINGGLLNYHDVTTRKQAEEALLESEARYRSFFEETHAVMLLIDPDNGTIVDANAAASTYYGWSRGELKRRKINEINTLTSDEVSAEMQLALSEKRSVFFFTHRRADGTLRDVEVYSGPVPLKGKTLLYSIVHDITKRKEAEEQIRRMAYRDSLTGLPNRKLFSDRLGITLTHAQRNKKDVGIAMLDLDNFKDVNDTLGHSVGDLLLKATAARLSESLRKGDTVARFGGDEFVLILPELKGMEDAIRVAQKIVDSFRKPFLIDTHQLVVTTSIGIAVYPDDGTDEDVLLKNADIAMYQAKQAGRDRYQLFKKA